MNHRELRRALLEDIASLSDPSTIGPLTGFHPASWERVKTFASQPGNRILTAPPGGGKSSLAHALTGSFPASVWHRRSSSDQQSDEAMQVLDCFSELVAKIPGLREAALDLDHGMMKKRKTEALQKLSSHLEREGKHIWIVQDEPQDSIQLTMGRIREPLPGITRLTLLNDQSPAKDTWESRPLSWDLEDLCAMTFKQLINASPSLRDHLRPIAEASGIALQPGKNPEELLKESEPRLGAGWTSHVRDNSKLSRERTAHQEVLNRIHGFRMGIRPGGEPVQIWMQRQIQEKFGSLLPRPFCMTIAKGAWAEMGLDLPDREISRTFPLIRPAALRTGMQRACEEQAAQLRENRRLSQPARPSDLNNRTT